MDQIILKPSDILSLGDIIYYADKTWHEVDRTLAGKRVDEIPGAVRVERRP